MKKPDRKSGWVVRASQESLDARSSPIAPCHLKLIQIIETSCRGKCYCWTSDEVLAQAYGCSKRNLQLHLAAMERAGLVERVYRRDDHAPNAKRIGLMLLRRTDTDQPMAADPAVRAEAIARLRSRGRPPSPEPSKKCAGSCDSQSAGSCANKCAGSCARIKTSKSLKDDEPLDDGPRAGRKAVLAPRPRPGPAPPTPAPPLLPTPKPAPRVGPPPAPPAPAADAEGLTPPQREFLDGLTPDQSARWRLLKPADREMFLGAFRLRDDPGMRAEVMRLLAPKAREPDIPPDATIEDLIRALATPLGRRGLAPRCARSIQVALNDRDRSYAPFLAYCERVVAGKARVDSLLEPFRKTLEAVAGGDVRNPGAYFVRSMKNWRPEAGGTEAPPDFVGNKNAGRRAILPRPPAAGPQRRSTQ